MMYMEIDGPRAEPVVSLGVRKVDIVVELPQISSERKKEFVLVQDLDDDDDDGNEVSFFVCQLLETEDGAHGTVCVGGREAVHLQEDTTRLSKWKSTEIRNQADMSDYQVEVTGP
jgi:hypothetical protein